jgi:hypothetical protein
MRLKSSASAPFSVFGKSPAVEPVDDTVVVFLAEARTWSASPPLCS